jgi:acyl-CoA synthetase (AMP-forming)/AMP-acid ligase II
LKGDANEEEIMEYVAGRVARYKRVRLVEFISEIPKSPAGKTLRRMLRDRERRAVTSRQ